jgi:hypothetical protein
LSVAEIIHFPVQKRMPVRVAEERLGRIVVYRYPSIFDTDIERQRYLDGWLGKKAVLLGWGAVKEGIVRSFKSGRVCHLVSRVAMVDNEEVRPRVEISCGLDSFPVWNWFSGEEVKTTPVVVLSLDQIPYFRVCDRCLLREEKCR